MQNIPGIETTADQTLFPTRTYQVNEGDQPSLFDELFKSHTNLMHQEMEYSPLTSSDKLVELAPEANKANTGKAAESIASADKAQTKKEATASAEQARVTKEELESIREELEAYGFSEEEIEDLRTKAESEEGLTWGQLMRKAAEKMKKGETKLTDEDKQKVLSLFDKLGFTDEQSEELLSKLEKGEFDQVLLAIQEQLKNLSPDQIVQFTSAEVEALTVALPLSKEFATQIKDLLGKQNTVAELQDIFSRMGNEVSDMEAKSDHLVKVLGKALVAAVGEAKGKELMDATVSRNQQGQTDHTPKVAADKIQTDAKESFHESMNERRDGNLPDGSRTLENFEAKNAVLANTSDSLDESSKNWEILNGKLQIKNPGENLNVKTTQSIDQASQLLNATATAAKAGAQQPTWQNVTAPKLLRQVQSAILTNLSNGTKQLEVQLEPENLGRLQITLNVNNKEVNAVIRAENSDAAKMIADQLESIRSTLEAQGLKVSKLDVQTSTPEQFSQGMWQGQENHNMSQERSAMAQLRSRMRTLRGQDQDLANIAQAGLSQTGTSGRGLHLIA